MRGKAMVLAVVLVLSLAAPAGFAGSATATPSGMASIPDENVDKDIPPGESINIGPSDLQNGRIMASKHSKSLDVVLTTPDRAAGIMDADAAAISGQDMAIILRDDRHSDGRRIAIDAGRLIDVLGHQPKAIYGTHEDGSQWTASAEYVDGYLVFDVPHFSTNTVTFSGSITVTADNVQNNTQFDYDIGDYDNVDNVSVTVTGDTNTLDDSMSKGLDSSGSFDITVDGNTDADVSVTLTGNGLNGYLQETNIGSTPSKQTDISDNYIAVSGSGDVELYTRSGTQEWSKSPADYDAPGVAIGPSESIYASIYQSGDKVVKYGSDGSSTTYSTPTSDKLHTAKDNLILGTGTVYAVDYNDPSTSNQIATGTAGTAATKSSSNVAVVTDSSPSYVQLVSASDGSQQWNTTFSGSTNGYMAYNGSNVYVATNGNDVKAFDGSNGSPKWNATDVVSNIGTVEVAGDFVVVDGDTTAYLDPATGDVVATDSGGNELSAYDIAGHSGGDLATLSSSELITYKPSKGTTDPTVDVGSNTVIDVTGEVAGGENKTGTTTLSPGTYTVGFSSSGDPADIATEWTEKTTTTDAEIKIDSENGTQKVSSNGTLADGSTADLTDSVDESLIGGQTTLTTTLDTPASGPTAEFDLTYKHSAANKVSTEYNSSRWEESYNTSTTYAEDTTGAEVTIPFSSDRVVAIDTVEYRINNGSWAALEDSEYEISQSKLTADIGQAYGDLNAGDTAAIRATGRKVEVQNGGITVTESTPPDEDLDTEIRVDSRNPEFYINIGTTRNGDRVHYANSFDYPTEDYVVIRSDGEQRLHLPKSKTGDTARIKHLETQVTAKQGDIRLDVVDSGSQPEIDVSPGPAGEGDPVEIKYYRTTTGVEYILQSLAQNIVLDSDKAQSPAIFEEDDSDDTWEILEDDGGGGSTTGSDEGIIGPVGNTGFEIPFSDSIRPLFALLAVGAVATVYFSGPDGSGSFRRIGGRAARSARSSVPLIGGLLARVASGIGSFLSIGFGGLVELARFLRARPRLTAGLAGIGSMAGVVAGVIPLPIELVFAAGVPLISFVLLREIGQFNVTVWGVTSAAGFIGSLVALGVSFDGLVNEQTSLILAVGGLYLAYQVVQTWRQGNINRIVLNRGD
jgi:hypothetical protein